MYKAICNFSWATLLRIAKAVGSIVYERCIFIKVRKVKYFDIPPKL